MSELLKQSAFDNHNSGQFTERAVFKCSPKLLEAIDRSADAGFTTRSNIIRDAVVDRLRREGMIPASQSPSEKGFSNV